MARPRMGTFMRSDLATYLKRRGSIAMYGMSIQEAWLGAMMYDSPCGGRFSTPVIRGYAKPSRVLPVAALALPSSRRYRKHSSNTYVVLLDDSLEELHHLEPQEPEDAEGQRQRHVVEPKEVDPHLANGHGGPISQGRADPGKRRAGRLLRRQSGRGEQSLASATWGQAQSSAWNGLQPRGQGRPCQNGT
eukprot:scaffold3825_cov225-Pinguiococcus_pyrenoidosus.AAC.3